MKTDIKTLLEFAGVDTSKGKAKELVEMYSGEEDLAAEIHRQLPELDNVGFIDGAVYVHDETNIDGKDVFWEWSEKDGYVAHHDVDGKAFTPEETQAITYKLKEMDPVRKSGKYDEEIEQIKELQTSYNKYRGEQDAEEGRGDYERDQMLDRRFEDR